MKLIPNLSDIDRQTIENFNIPGLTLMENAGTYVANAVKNWTSNTSDPITIVCGAGNNGGDGYVCARLLADEGFSNLVVIHTHPAENLSGDAKTNFERLSEKNIRCLLASQQNESDINKLLLSAHVIIDALFGSGLTRNIEGIPKQLIKTMNLAKNNGTKIVAVDLPSGINGASGDVKGIAAWADTTVTFATAKPGLFIGDGKVYAGKVTVVDIGIPEKLIEDDPSQTYLVTPELASQYLPDRGSPEAKKGHKYSFGHVLVLAGSEFMPGAACLSAHSAIVSGAGLVSLASPQLAINQMPLLPEIMRVDIDSRNGEFSPEDIQTLEENTQQFERINTILVGPGLGVTEGTTRFFENLMYSLNSTGYRGQVVIDADGLNCLAQNPRTLNEHFVLTPHIGEAKRLLDGQESDLVTMARAIQQKFNCHVVLKSASTITATMDGSIWVNPTGCNALATAGSGDVLAGLIAGLSAQDIELQNAAKLGAYLHGLAGEIAAEDLTPYCVTASKIIDCLPEAYAEVMT